MTEKFYELLENLPNKEVDSLKFSEIFQVEGIPLWYFLEPLMKAPQIPKPFRSLEDIERGTKENRAPSSLDSFKLSVLKKILDFNEKLKLWISSGGKEKLIESGTADILFIAYTNQIFEKNGKLKFLGFGDIVNDLKKRGVKPLVLICDPLSKNSFFGLKKFENPLYAHIDPEIVKESITISRELVRKWKKIDKKLLFDYHGKNYWKFLENEMNFLFSREILETLIKYYITFKKIIKKYDIKLIYLTDIIGIYESALFGAAYKLDKKILYSPHGYGGYAVPRYLREEFYRKLLFAASGAEERKRLLKLRIKRENIFVTGSPFFDKIALYKQKQPSGAEKKTIILLTTFVVEAKFVEKEEYFKYIKKFLSQIKKVDYKKIIIKLHPAERYKTEYESIVKSLNLKNVEVVQTRSKESLYSMLRDSDLLISFGSTADIEGLMLDKDAIIIEGFMDPVYRKDPYKKAVIQIEKEDDLTSVIKNFFGNEREQEKLRKKRNEYIKRAFSKIDGKAHERVADLIFRLIRK